MGKDTMKISLRCLLLPLLTASGFVLHGADFEYPYSLDEARELGETEGAKFHAEFGDTEGPFHWIGSARTISSSYPDFRVRMGEGPSLFDSDVRDPAVSLKVYYFVNKKGNGLGVVYRAPTRGEHLPEDEPVDDRPTAHRALSEAAEYALISENKDLLANLIDSGLDVNLPVDLEGGTTALHLASLFENENIVSFLLSQGADPGVRDRFGDRAIDDAVGKNHTAICELLRLPEGTEEMIDGFPAKLVEEAFLKREAPNGAAFFVSFNGNRASDDLLKLFRSHWPNSKIYPASEMVEGVSGRVGESRSTSVYRHSGNAEHGYALQLSLNEAEGDGFVWSVRTASGPSLSGGGVKGIARKDYGYWIAEQTSSWDE